MLEQVGDVAAVERDLAPEHALAVDRGGDDVARAHLVDEASPVGEEVSAGATDRLGDQRQGSPRAAADVEARGVELHELEVGEPGPGTSGEDHPAAPGAERVRRVAVEGGAATRREHDAAGPQLQRTVRIQHEDAGDAVVVDEQLQRSPADDGDVGGGGDLRREGVDDRRSCAVAADVADPVPAVAPFAPEGELTGGVPVEGDAGRHELGDESGGGLGHPGDRRGVTGEGPGPRGVVRVLLRVVPGPTAAAMPPCAQALAVPSPRPAGATTTHGPPR